MNGSIIIWTVLASTLGKMEESTRANTKTIKSMDLEYIFGQMAVSTREIGQRASSTD